MAKKKVTKKAVNVGAVKGKAKGKKKAVKKAPAKKVMAKRDDLGKPGSVVIEAMEAGSRAIARVADKLVMRTVPTATSVVKWGNVCYYRDGRAFAVMYATKLGVNLGMAGATLKDPGALLEGTGRSMRHVKLHDAEMAGSESVAELLRQAVEIGIHRM